MVDIAGDWSPSMYSTVRFQNPALRAKYRRLSGGSERKDFLSHVVGKVEAGEMPVEEMTAHASTLVSVSPLVPL